MIHSDIGMCMEDLKDIFVGERVSEGFGEILAEKQRDAKFWSENQKAGTNQPM